MFHAAIFSAQIILYLLIDIFPSSVPTSANISTTVTVKNRPMHINVKGVTFRAIYVVSLFHLCFSCMHTPFV